MSHEKDLCAKQLHPRVGDGPCEKCKQGKGNRCQKGHDLDAPDATYTLKDGRQRCRLCKKDRARRSRAKAKRLKAEAERGIDVEAVPTPEATFALPPQATSREAQARVRHAVMVRQQQGLM